MKIQIATYSGEDRKEYLSFPIFEAEKSVVAGSIKPFLEENPKFGKLYETELIFGPQKILLVGGGKKEQLDFERLQNIIGTAVKFSLFKFKELSFYLPEISLAAEKVGEAAALGVEIASFDLSREYKSEKEPVKLTNVQILVKKAEKGLQEGLKKGQIMADSINLLRRLGDMPANEMTPTYFLNQVKKVAKELKLKLTVIDEKQAKKLGMGAFVGVAKGSGEPSYIISLEYKGDLRSKEKWGIVGKGITFDSGGISIKPSQSMHEMKYDMCGAASVLAAMQILARLKVKKNIIGVMCVTENLPGGRAQRPGDIVKTYSGKTAEVLNTDAEGRLVLVDGLTLAQKKGATNLLDLATLTGACVVALGSLATGVMGNNPKFTQDVIVAGAKVGEKMWELPMFEEYSEFIKSDFADMTNVGHGGPGWTSGSAGAITAAKFLEAVVEKDKPWVHLDIAGTAWDLSKKPFRVPGATGVGVKTLVELIGK